MQNLLHFLTDLSLNPKRQEQYAQNPATTLAAAQLPSSIHDDLQTNNLSTQDLTAVTGSCVFADPGPDPLPDPDPIPVPPDEVE